MSVIHQMLTELDARHAPRPPTLADFTFAALPSAINPAPRQPARRWLAAGTVLICTLALAGWQQLADGVADSATSEITGEATSDATSDATSEAAGGTTAWTSSGTAHSPLLNTFDLALTEPPSAGPPQSPAPAHKTRAIAPSNVHTAPRATPGNDAPASAPLAALQVAMASTDSPLPGTPPAAEAIIEKRLVPPSTAQRAALAYRQAVELASSGHGSQAIDKARETLKADPDHTAARQLAAALLFEKNQLDEAEALLREGLARQANQPPLVYLLARLKAETGDTAGALATLAQADELSADGHGLRAVILARQGRYREALPAYEAAARLAPQNASWWLGLGVALDAEGQTANAVRALQRARAIGSLQGELLSFVDQKLAALKQGQGSTAMNAAP